MTVTTEQRALWRRLAAEATPGPWWIDWEGTKETMVSATAGNVVTVHTGQPTAQPRPDAAFIAAARSAVPALLEALDEAERERDRLIALNDLHSQEIAGHVARERKDLEEWKAFRSERDALALRVEDLATFAEETIDDLDTVKRTAGSGKSIEAFVNGMQARARAALSPPATPGATTTNRNEE